MLNVLRHPSSLVDKDAAAQPRAARMGGSLVSFLLLNIHLEKGILELPCTTLSRP